MGKRAFVLLILAAIVTVVAGCTDLDSMDLSCRIPLTEYDDMVGTWKDLVSYSDSRRADNPISSFFTVLRLRDYAVTRNSPASFVAGATTYTLNYRVGQAPTLTDQYGNLVPLTESKTSFDGDWNHEIGCSLANVGRGVGFEEHHNLAFTIPETGRTCAIWAHSWVRIRINKAQGSYVDFHGNTVYYDYPYADINWGVNTKVGVRYYLKGSAYIPGEEVDVRLTALVIDSNMDGAITELDTVIITPYAKGGTKGGLYERSYPFNQYVRLSERQGYILNLVTEQGPEGPRYFVDIKKQ